jgi:hypothetical protein
VAREIARGNGRPFPDPPATDPHGLPIAVWTFFGPVEDLGEKAATHS